MAFFKKKSDLEKQEEFMEQDITSNNLAQENIENLSTQKESETPLENTPNIEISERPKKQRTSPHKKKLEQHDQNFPKQDSQQTVKLIPLGGLGEIGRNMMAIEIGQDIVIIDAGVMFPDANYPGIDLLLPDFTYLKNKAKHIKALMITHGHEDHIGAVPFFLKEFPGIPVYAPRMAMELIKGKLNEHKIQYDRKKLTYTDKKKTYNISHSFAIEYVEVNHSIRDSYGLAIHTPIGTIVHTGDFKIEVDSLGDSEFDLHKFAELGQKGVLLLCSDSTNVEKKVEEKTEADVTRNIKQIIDFAEGRVIISTFASNVNRVAKIVEVSEKAGKKVALLGRNMENNFEIAQRLGYVNASKSTIIPIQSAKNHPDNKLVIISTGTQGETLSALTRISQGLHKIIKIKNTDTVVISASVIPGNEKPVSKVLDNLSSKTKKVLYSRNASVHVSGHGAQNDLLTMLRLIKPKFFMPVHGEKRFLIQHTYLAHSVGVPENNTIVAQNGDVLELSQKSIKCIQQLKHQDILVENNTIGNYNSVIQDRLSLANAGTLFVVIGLDTSDAQIPPIIYTGSKGFLLPEKEKECLKEIRHHIEKLIASETLEDQHLGSLTTKCRKAVEFLLNAKYSKKPLVELKIIERSK